LDSAPLQSRIGFVIALREDQIRAAVEDERLPYVGRTEDLKIK
jgi:hypothetical protein